MNYLHSINYLSLISFYIELIYVNIIILIISVLTAIYLLLADTENQEQSLIDEATISIDEDDEFNETD